MKWILVTSFYSGSFRTLPIAVAHLRAIVGPDFPVMPGTLMQWVDLNGTKQTIMLGWEFDA